MASQTNRSLAAKNIKARDARMVEGMALACQFDTMITRHIPKSVLRSIADMLPTDLALRKAVAASVEAPTMKLYNPRIYRQAKPLAMRVNYVDFAPVLIKRV